MRNMTYRFSKFHTGGFIHLQLTDFPQAGWRIRDSTYIYRLWFPSNWSFFHFHKDCWQTHQDLKIKYDTFIGREFPLKTVNISVFVVWCFAWTAQVETHTHSPFLEKILKTKSWIISAAPLQWPWGNIFRIFHTSSGTVINYVFPSFLARRLSIIYNFFYSPADVHT
jgi:hypothetical protein